MGVAVSTTGTKMKASIHKFKATSELNLAGASDLDDEQLKKYDSKHKQIYLFKDLFNILIKAFSKGFHAGSLKALKADQGSVGRTHTVVSTLTPEIRKARRENLDYKVLLATAPNLVSEIKSLVNTLKLHDDAWKAFGISSQDHGAEAAAVKILLKKVGELERAGEKQGKIDEEQSDAMVVGSGRTLSTDKLLNWCAGSETYEEYMDEFGESNEEDEKYTHNKRKIHQMQVKLVFTALINLGFRTIVMKEEAKLNKFIQDSGDKTGYMEKASTAVARNPNSVMASKAAAATAATAGLVAVAGTAGAAGAVGAGLVAARHLYKKQKNQEDKKDGGGRLINSRRTRRTYRKKRSRKRSRKRSKKRSKKHKSKKRSKKHKSKKKTKRLTKR